ncbi:MAG TPA: sialidase family protein [Thermoanaerobaculia bacterium]|nr:sialidase family protein [Thermoanaerobaculia bacterium]
MAGSPVLSWLEPAPKQPGQGQPADRERWRLRVSRLDASSWSTPVTVTEGEDLLANWADFPAVGSNGSALVSHWLVQGVGAGEAYSIALAGSGDGGATWRRLGRLPADRTAAEHGFVSWVPDRLEGGGLRAFWLDGRGMADGGPMALRSALVDPERGASGEELLDERVCDCCQTDAAMTSDGPIVVYRDRSPEEIRDIAIRRLTPAGWSAPALVYADGWHIEGCPVNGPAVAASGRKVAVAWFTGAPSPRVLLAFSDDSGATFSPPIPLDTETPLGRVDLVLDRQGSAIVSWLGQEPGKSERSALRLRRVSPSDESAPAITLATTSSARANGFPRLLLAEDRNLMVAWTEPGSPGRLHAARVGLGRLGQAAP